jgi:hypothetical protein
MRTIAGALILLIFTPYWAWAQSASIERAVITNFGIYELEIKKEKDGKAPPRRSWEVVTRFRHVETTTTIPARLCTSFGFEYTIVGAPAGVEIPIKMIAKFPSQGMYDPEKRATTYRTEALVDRAIGRSHLRSYTLDKQWELVPGVWTFELWHRERKLAEQTFTLSAPCREGCDQAERPKRNCEQIPIAVALAPP